LDCDKLTRLFATDKLIYRISVPLLHDPGSIEWPDHILILDIKTVKLARHSFFVGLTSRRRWMTLHFRNAPRTACVNDTQETSRSVSQTRQVTNGGDRNDDDTTVGTSNYLDPKKISKNPRQLLPSPPYISQLPQCLTKTKNNPINETQDPSRIPNYTTGIPFYIYTHPCICICTS
jgi:hypothetical protein